MSDSPGYHGETDSLGYATPVSLTCWGMQPWGDFMKNLVQWLPGVWYPCEFDSPGYDNQASQAHRGIKPRGVMFWPIFLLTCWGMIPRWVMLLHGHFNSICWTWDRDPREIDSAQYDTPGRLTCQGIIPWGDFNTNILTNDSPVPRVWYPGEIDSAQYDTQGGFLKIRITQRNLN